MKSFIHTVGRVNEWTGRLAGLLILAVVFIILREVIARSFFSSPSLWADESTTYLASFAYVLGGGYTLRNRGHVRVDMVYDRLGPTGKKFCDLIAFVLFSLYCATLIWYGWSLAITSFDQSESSGTLWNPAIWPVKFAIPIAGVLLYLQGTANLLQDLYENQ
jgi:TRAP-type mannitol/chloroaromatic compound transport system permease small subunit